VVDLKQHRGHIAGRFGKVKSVDGVYRGAIAGLGEGEPLRGCPVAGAADVLPGRKPPFWAAKRPACPYKTPYKIDSL
jgi:hypothetical protein